MLRPIEMRHLALLELAGEELIPEGHALICARQGHTDCLQNRQRTAEVMHALYLLRQRFERRWSEENERQPNRWEPAFPPPTPSGEKQP